MKMFGRHHLFFAYFLQKIFKRKDFMGFLIEIISSQNIFNRSTLIFFKDLKKVSPKNLFEIFRRSSIKF